MIPNLSKPNIEWDSTKRIFIKENALNEAECDALINEQTENLHKGHDKYPALFTTSFDSCLLPLNHSIHSSLQAVFREINVFLNIDASFVEPYEIKRYSKGDYFGQHTDNYFSITEDIDRKITIVAILSDDGTYAGGNLNILGHSIKGKRGTVIAFPSFFPHHVEEVTSGERWSLITWLWGSYWK